MAEPNWSGDWWQYVLAGFALCALPGVLGLARQVLKPGQRRHVLRQFRREHPGVRILGVARRRYGTSRAYDIHFVDASGERCLGYHYCAEDDRVHRI